MEGIMVEFGHRSMNLIIKTERVNLKIYLPKLKHCAIKEFKVLQILHDRGLNVPRPIKLIGSLNCLILIREYIEGMHFNEALERLDAESLKRVLVNLIMQIHEIEKLGIYIPEFSSLSRNVVVSGNKPYIIDLERALFRKKPIITQLLGLFFKLSRSPKLREKLSKIINFGKVRSAAELYKRTNNIAAVWNILA